MNLSHFKTYSKQDILSLTRLRRFETKLGERVDVLSSPEEGFANNSCKYVLFGIPEDLGIQGNYGTAGAATTWIPFLQSFLNIQSNDFLSGEQVMVAGHFDFGDLQYLIDKNAKTPEEKIEAYRHAVMIIDDEVEALAKSIVQANKVPIVVGGGHNNCYPLIKGTAKGLFQNQKIKQTRINAINLDAHTDYRPSEGRHSGNGFRYAEEDGFLSKYCAIGVHENYLPQNVWMDIVNNPATDIISFEDIFIYEKRTFRQAVMHAIEFTEDNFTGVEIDLDSIRNILSSASSPTGVTLTEARQFASLAASNAKACYLHICEGAARLADGRSDELTGKLITYLVSDFIKMQNL